MPLRRTTPPVEGSSSEYLTLGWRVNSARDPLYWLGTHPRPGRQTDNDLVRVPAEALANHLVLIAQSGSGKSYFLGRLVEEILIHTRCRCVILDPNADFRFANIVESTDLWTKARYDSNSRSGKLPHERDRDAFQVDWNRVGVAVRLGPAAGPEDSNDRSAYKPLRLHIRNFSAELLLDEVEEELRHQIYHCHDFLKSILLLQDLQYIADKKTVDVLEKAETLFAENFGKRKEERRDQLSALVNVDALAVGGSKPPISAGELTVLQHALGTDVRRRILDHTVRTAAERAASSLGYTSNDAARIYFGLLRRQKDAGLLVVNSGPSSFSASSSRLTVIDLPSIPSRISRRLAVNAVLAEEWESARSSWNNALRRSPATDRRVPTFIVVDEAHNLLPEAATTRGELALREQFRLIAAEGRKYGLFLILVSQRPDKLDGLVVSECENRAIMRLGTRSSLDSARRLLDLSDVPERVLGKCLEFERSRVLIVGPWATEGPQTFMSAARRTKEGGRNLRSEFWGKAPWHNVQRKRRKRPLRKENVGEKTTGE